MAGIGKLECSPKDTGAQIIVLPNSEPDGEYLTPDSSQYYVTPDGSQYYQQP